MSNISYRPAKAADAGTLQHLLKELGYKVSASEIGARLTAIRCHGGEVIVATLNNDVVGCVHVTIELRMAEGEFGEIASLVVDSRQRGSGIGSGLLEQTRTWLIDRGLTSLRVRMNTQRERSYAFYSGQGFRDTKTQTVFISELNAD
ncbi:GNAT family N-acetyltransferase [Aestuariirhabdus sp. Z084]|uniref:GNAT family N-acetyltransferase n=1 Tax=Aestuariirhabdus haliotis TaxID=2918751 RepID=UPI00201B3DF3|nr:GNAT family N-acetyltransferase [Aestuariirhabdus haliotis]MCL6417535.1 GNAT family N-acetyltransferase [Aestuariirhabdus haliotis]MCL6421478.1 GNAT family N-acetyltransferase [Aestuariirhabdus haliotis]